MNTLLLFLAGVYLGGVLGSISRELRWWGQQTSRQKHRRRRTGRPLLRAVVMIVFWPLDWAVTTFVALLQGVKRYAGM